MFTMKKFSLLSATILVPAAFCMIPTTAVAQSTTEAPAPADEAEDGDDKELIVVTGSRIRRAGFDTLEPALVISQQYLDTRGLTNAADALNELPGFGVGVTPEGGQSGFGVGQNFVNRFGLGSNRTLTTVNGRRFVSSNATTVFGPAAPGVQVDLNVIPSELIERIENLTIGGAPAYGSDAIAGVVNVILKKNFEGFQISGLSGITSKGDNQRYNISATSGINFNEGRGNIAVSVSYDNSKGVLATERKRFAAAIVTGTNPLAGSASATLPGRTPATDGRVSPNVPFNTGGADGIPNSVFVRDGRIFSLTRGGLLLPSTGATTIANGLPRGFGAANTLVQFDQSGNLVPFNPGIPFGVQNAFGGDGVRLNDSVSLLADLERYTTSAIGHYDITDKISVFFEGNYYYAKAKEINDQPIFNATLFGGVSAPLIFSATDPRLTPQARTTLAGLGVTDFRVSRYSDDLVVNRAASNQELYRLVGGFNGNFELFGNDYRWEVSANYGRSKGEFFQTVLNQQRFANAINVTTNAAGQIVCNPTPTRNVAPGGINPIADPNCVPLDVFGANRASAASLAYVTARTRATAVLEQEVYTATLDGNLFSLWAGPIGAAIGYEHREERGQFQPDAFQLAGLGRAVPILANGGKFNTDEVFGELSLPLVSPKNNVPLIHSLELEAKGRYVDNTVNGGFTTYTFGGRYSPIADIQFRGNYTRSLRAPALVELFTTRTPLFSAFNDPCDSINAGSGANPAARTRNCAAFYADYGINGATFSSVARSATQPALTGGDPNLENEEAKSYTFGVVLKPSFLPRFRAAVDWNRIKIIGNIANLNANDIATGCYDNDNFDATNVDDANQFCSRFDRVRGGINNGQLVSDSANPGLRLGFTNGAFILFKGLTAEIDYNFPVTLFGSEATFDIGGSFFYLDTLDINNTGVVNNPNAGEIGDPKYSGQFNLGYTQGKLGVDFRANYTGRAKFNILNTVETQDILSVNDQWILGLSASYKFKEETIIRFNVSNLTDKQAPFPVSGAAFGAYDTLGRRYTVSLDYRF
jgi:outer membrane receptor protein involved in Fe transport